MEENFSQNLLNTSLNYCSGCHFMDINAMLKMSIIDGFKTVIVHGENAENPWKIQQDVYQFCALSDQIISTSLGVRLGNPNLDVITLLQGYSQLLMNTTDFIYSAQNHQKLTVLLLNQGMMPNLDPLLFAITNGATFIGQEFADRPNRLGTLLVKAFKHPGFAFINILQPCRNPSHSRYPIVKVNNEEDAKSQEAAITIINAARNKMTLTGIVYVDALLKNQKSKEIDLVSKKDSDSNFESFLEKMR